jgi:hypothetical protein
MQAEINLMPILSSNLGRNLLGGFFTNLNLTDSGFLQSENDCDSEETPVEEQRPTSETDQYITQSQILQRTAEVNVCTN